MHQASILLVSSLAILFTLQMLEAAPQDRLLSTVTERPEPSFWESFSDRMNDYEDRVSAVFKEAFKGQKVVVENEEEAASEIESFRKSFMEGLESIRNLFSSNS